MLLGFVKPAKQGISSSFKRFYLCFRISKSVELKEQKMSVYLVMSFRFNMHQKDTHQLPLPCPSLIDSPNIICIPRTHLEHRQDGRGDVYTNLTKVLLLKIFEGLIS